MDDRVKKIVTAAGVAAATAGIAVAATRGKARKGEEEGADGVAVYHVLPRGEGWALEGEGAERAASRHDTKKEAVARGRELARSAAPSRLVIHGADGKIQRSHGYEVG